MAPTETELDAYWRKVSKRALIHLSNRPLKLVRRVGNTIFYHKGPLPRIPRSVHQLTIAKREGGEGVRVWVDDLAGLLGLVEMGVVELHPWNATVNDIEHAARLVFDLDPGLGVEWPFGIDTALDLRRLLEQEGFKTWPKVTGGKGLHIMAPLTDQISHDEALRYSRTIASASPRPIPAITPSRRRWRSGLGGSSSTTCATAGERRRRVPGRRARGRAFRSPRR